MLATTSLMKTMERERNVSSSLEEVDLLRSNREVIGLLNRLIVGSEKHWEKSSIRDEISLSQQEQLKMSLERVMNEQG